MSFSLCHICNIFPLLCTLLLKMYPRFFWGGGSETHWWCWGQKLTFHVWCIWHHRVNLLPQVWRRGTSPRVWSDSEVKCDSADIAIPLSSPPSSSLPYLSSCVLSYAPLISLSLSISSLFTAYSVWSLPTLTALQSFIKPLINSTLTFRYRHMHTCDFMERFGKVCVRCACVCLKACWEHSCLCCK